MRSTGESSTGRGGTGVVASAETLHGTVTGGGWVAPGLDTGAGMTALSAAMRPIDTVAAAGLSWLAPKVQPFQDVLDRLAGNGSVIQTFADAWQRAAQTVEQVGQQLSHTSSAATEQWQGVAADNYRGRATEIADGLRGSATTFAAVSTVATVAGEVVAGARTQINDLVGDLVNRLISYVGQATAAEGGVTPNVMAQATSMIDSYSAPIADIENKLRQTVGNLEVVLTGGNSSGVAGSPQGNQRSVHLALLEGPMPDVPTPLPDTRPPGPRPRPPIPRPKPSPKAGGPLGILLFLLWLLGILEEEEEELTPIPPPGTPVPPPGTPPVQQPGTPPVQQPGTPPVQQPGTPPIPQPGTPPVQQPGTPEAVPPPAETPPAEQPGTPPIQEPGTPPAVPPPGDTPPAQQPGTPPVPQPGTPPVTPPQTPQQGTPPHMGDDPPPKDEPPPQPGQPAPAPQQETTPPSRPWPEEPSPPSDEEIERMFQEQERDAPPPGQEPPNPVPGDGTTVEQEFSTPEEALAGLGLGRQDIYSIGRTTNEQLVEQGFTNAYQAQDRNGNYWTLFSNRNGTRWTRPHWSSENN